MCLGCIHALHCFVSQPGSRMQVSSSSHNPSLFHLSVQSHLQRDKSYTWVKFPLPFHPCKYLVTVLRLHHTLHVFVCLLFLWWVPFLCFVFKGFCLSGAEDWTWVSSTVTASTTKVHTQPQGQFFGLGFLAFMYRVESQRIMGPARPITDCTVFSSFLTNSIKYLIYDSK